jgi:hypothetical protein
MPNSLPVIEAESEACPGDKIAASLQLLAMAGMSLYDEYT